METSPAHDALLERIRVKSEEAYQYLVEIRDTEELSSSCNYSYKTYLGVLPALMTWGNTPQGHDYWLNINDSL